MLEGSFNNLVAVRTLDLNANRDKTMSRKARRAAK